MIIVLPSFDNKACFVVFSRVTEWFRPDCDKKYSEKVTCQHFVPIFADFMPENIGKFPYFHKKSRYLINTFLETSSPRKVILSSNLDQLLLGTWGRNARKLF